MIDIKWSKVTQNSAQPPIPFENDGGWYIKDLYGIKNCNAFMIKDYKETWKKWKYLRIVYTNPETNYNNIITVRIVRNPYISISTFKASCKLYIQSYRKTLIDKILCKSENEMDILLKSIKACNDLDDNIKKKESLEQTLIDIDKEYNERLKQWHIDIRNGVKIDITPLGPAYMYADAGMRYPNNWDGESRIYSDPVQPKMSIMYNVYKKQLDEIIDIIDIGIKRKEKLNSSWYDEEWRKNV